MKDFAVANSFFDPAPPGKEQVDIYVSPNGQVRRAPAAADAGSFVSRRGLLQMKEAKESRGGLSQLIGARQALRRGAGSTSKGYTATSHYLANGQMAVDVDIPDGSADRHDKTLAVGAESSADSGNGYAATGHYLPNGDMAVDIHIPDGAHERDGALHEGVGADSIAGSGGESAAKSFFLGTGAKLAKSSGDGYSATGHYLPNGDLAVDLHTPETSSDS